MADLSRGERLSISSYYSSEDDQGNASPPRKRISQDSAHGQSSSPLKRLKIDDDHSQSVAKDFIVENASTKKKEGEYSSFAKRMMAKMGHKEGKGLGRNQQGRAEIIEASKQRGRRGLGLSVQGFEEADVGWDFSKDEIILEEKIEWLPECKDEPVAFEVMKEWMEEGPKVTDMSEQVEFVSPETLKAVLDCKSVFDNLEDEELRRARTRSNAYETIRGGIFLNRAAMKMANMDAILDFMFTEPKHPNGHPMLKPTDLLYFADVCAGPGGFSEYVLWRKKWHSKGFGFTLKGPCDFKLENFFAAPSELFEPHYGVGGLDGDGDIYKPDNINAFREFVLENTDGQGVHFCMADGGFSVEGQENLQEPLSNRLYLCQFLMSLAIVRTGGHFVCKLFDVFTPYSVGLVYLMYRAYQQVAIIKPVTSRPANSERYIVCKWKRADCQPIYDYMFHLNCHLERISSILTDTTISQCVPLSVLNHDAAFADYVARSNEEIGAAQCVGLKKIQTFARNPELLETRQAETREELMRRWGVPDEARTAPSRTEKCDAMFRRLVQGTEEEYEISPKTLTPHNLHEIKSVFDYRCVVNGASQRFYLLSLGKSHVFRWDGHQWRKVDDIVKLELPRETIVEAEFVQELRGEARGQRKVMAVHMLDALVLNGTDVRDKHFNERQDLLRKFAKAVSRPTRSDLAPIRVKDMHRLEQINNIFKRLEMKLVKGGGQRQRLCYCFDDVNPAKRQFFIPTGITLVKTIKDPWMMAFSRSSQRKYFFHTLKHESKFEIPPDSIAAYMDCLQHRLLWSWDERTQLLEDSQHTSDSSQLSHQAISHFIHKMLPH